MLEIKEMRVSDIIPYENNPRKNDGAVEAVANSIKEFGFKVPIIVDKENVIVAGHTRLKAAELLGLETVPVIRADDLTEEQVNAFRLADNKTGELAEWDFTKLEEELSQLENIDMTQFGFDESAFGDELEEIVEDEVPEAEEETTVKRGDIYQLGEHRLMCGDATEEKDIQALIEGKAIDLCLTDPPYGINVVNTSTVGGGGALHFNKGRVGGENIVKARLYKDVIGDDSTETAKKHFEIIKRWSKNQIMFGGNYFTDFLYPSRCWIVWDKQNTGNFADAELAWTSFSNGVKLYKYMWNGLAREGSREIEGKTRVHPTQKPVGLMGYCLRDFLKDGETVIDCFGGSGSTLIASEQLKKQCYMMEIDPYYCDVIIKRWETFTGRKAVKIS